MCVQHTGLRGGLHSCLYREKVLQVTNTIDINAPLSALSVLDKASGMILDKLAGTSKKPWVIFHCTDLALTARQ
jgi:hypothetical protein